VSTIRSYWIQFNGYVESKLQRYLIEKTFMTSIEWMRWLNLVWFLYSRWEIKDDSDENDVSFLEQYNWLKKLTLQLEMRNSFEVANSI
jgi:hypothetical protein